MHTSAGCNQFTHDYTTSVKARSLTWQRQTEEVSDVKIVKLNAEPMDGFDYLNAVPGGEVAAARLPIYHAIVSGLPEHLDALLVASDLQGIVPVKVCSGNERQVTGRGLSDNGGSPCVHNMEQDDEYTNENTNKYANEQIGGNSGIKGGTGSCVSGRDPNAANLYAFNMGEDGARDQTVDRLLGELLPEHAKLLLEVYWPQLDPRRTGVLLCGDLYARRGKRGASGNPLPVWLAFREAFSWVAGVDGNHDLTDEASAHRLHRAEGIHYLDAPGVVSAGPVPDGPAPSHAGPVPGRPAPRAVGQQRPLRIAGLGGIIGRPDKPNRLPEKQYLQSLTKLLKQQPDCLLLHQSPGIPELGCMGEPLIRQALEAGPETVVFCGHTHWEQPLVQLDNGTQILNADGRLFILTREEADNAGR
ncbi:metallophosphoesterase family protein [Paenibacillus sp. FSL W8-0426]|uniref:metallophosphoesterase family protein n=1 Tax=Paenibacillus sp. FSL W8-0426 TaxID=2921714 RepID=UPI0030D810A9